MIEFVVLCVLGFVLLTVIGVLVAGLSLVLLPLKLMGWMFKGVGLLLALPFLLVFGVLAAVVFGFGVLMFLIPFLPFALLGWILWKVFHRRPRPLST